MSGDLVPISVTVNGTTYYFKGSLLQNTTRTNTLTEYPTIEGTTFTDHCYREPESASFEVHASEISKSLVYSVEIDSDLVRHEHYLTVEEVIDLVAGWFKNAPRVTVTSLRFVFNNMVLQSYSWSDEDLSNFNPTLTFREARVARVVDGIVENADLWYQAAYGEIKDVGSPTSAQDEVNTASLLGSIGGWAAGGAIVGSIIPGVGTVAGGVIGAGIGALVNGNQVGKAIERGVNGAIGAIKNWFHIG